MQEQNEIWVPVNGYEGHYEVSNMGQLRSIDRVLKCGTKNRIHHGKIKSLTPHYKNGYFSVMLKVKSIEKRCFIHRLVAEHFIPNPENKKEVNHKEGIKSKNTVNDLEWATPKENTQHSIHTGLNTNSDAVIITKDTAIVEFKSKKECAKFLGVCDSWVGQMIKRNLTRNGYNIHSLCV